MHILLLYNNTPFDAFISALKRHRNITVEQTDDGRKALSALKTGKVDAIIIDENLGDRSGLSLLNEVVTTHPMVATVLVSSRNQDDFHEATEGLGVLMSLSTAPDAKEAEVLVEKLFKIADLMDNSKGRP